MAKGQVFTIPSGTAVLRNTQANTEKQSFALLNPNDGVVYLAIDRAADTSLGGWDWKLPSQSYGMFPGPWTSLGLFYLDQSGAGVAGEVNLYDADDKIVLPDIHSIGRALQARQNTLDITEGVQPPNPPLGVLREWADNTGLAHLLSSGGTDDTLLQSVLAQTVFGKTFDGSSNVLSRISRTKIAVQLGSFGFANIPQNYNHLLMVCRTRTTSTSAGALDGVRMQINSISTANYYNERLFVNAGTVSGIETGLITVATIGLTPDSLAAAGEFGVTLTFIPEYNLAANHDAISLYSTFTSGGSGGIGVGMLNSHIEFVAAINRIDILPGAGVWDVDSSFSLYGF